MKESAYNLSAQDPNGNYYLYNTRTGAARVVSAGAYRSYWAAANGESDLEDGAELLRDLVGQGFLVENDADEQAEIVSAHRNARRSSERIELLIAPSMACNLDCSYCFESNRYPGRMGAAVQANILRLARGYFESGTRQLDITWYGGEPLLAFLTIKKLSEGFMALSDELGCGYSAAIVTNGTLMTAEKAQQLAALKVKHAQITLDGVPELHDMRRVPRNRKPTFVTILNGIEAAAAHMRVSVRINVCRQVAARLEELLEILAARALNRMVSVYMAPLQHVRNNTSPPQFDTLGGGEAANLVLRFDDLLRKYGFAVSHRLPEPRDTTCMADKENSWLIEANGDVHKCYWTAGLRGEAAGRITAGGIMPEPPCRGWQDWTEFRNPDCQQCVMFPICLGRCPLKHLTHGADYCPAFKYNWVDVLARSAGVAQLVAVKLPLAGEKVKECHRFSQRQGRR
jgi:uncharacterized protein